MGRKIDLVGQQFGELLVLQETEKRKNKSVVWKCRCSCGEVIYLSTKELRSNGIQSCKSCNISPSPQKILSDLIGKKFNHWTVLEPTSQRQSGKILFKVQCDCVNQTIAYHTRYELETGRTKDCGCVKHKYQIGEIINNFEIISYTHIQTTPYRVRCLRCNSIKNYSTQQLEENLSCGCLRLSKGEEEIEKLLKRYKIPYKREYSFPNSKFRYDFLILKNNEPFKLIEFDGECHYKDFIKNKGWNSEEHYLQTKKRDEQKNILAKEQGIPLLRIPYFKRGKITIEDLFRKGEYEL